MNRRAFLTMSAGLTGTEATLQGWKSGAVVVQAGRRIEIAGREFVVEHRAQPILLERVERATKHPAAEPLDERVGTGGWIGGRIARHDQREVDPGRDIFGRGHIGLDGELGDRCHLVAFEPTDGFVGRKVVDFCIVDTD